MCQVGVGFVLSAATVGKPARCNGCGQAKPRDCVPGGPVHNRCGGTPGPALPTQPPRAFRRSPVALPSSGCKHGLGCPFVDLPNRTGPHIPTRLRLRQRPPTDLLQPMIGPTQRIQIALDRAPTISPPHRVIHLTTMRRARTPRRHTGPVADRDKLRQRRRGPIRAPVHILDHTRDRVGEHPPPGRITRRQLLTRLPGDRPIPGQNPRIITHTSQSCRGHMQVGGHRHPRITLTQDQIQHHIVPQRRQRPFITAGAQAASRIIKQQPGQEHPLPRAINGQLGRAIFHGFEVDSPVSFSLLAAAFGRGGVNPITLIPSSRTNLRQRPIRRLGQHLRLHHPSVLHRQTLRDVNQRPSLRHINRAILHRCQRIGETLGERLGKGELRFRVRTRNMQR
jgi:hypothetical protein